MRRFIRFSELKPKKNEDCSRLHAQLWPELPERLTSCGIRNCSYSISIRGTTLYTYFAYTGDDYAADMARMEASP